MGRTKFSREFKLEAVRLLGIAALRCLRLAAPHLLSNGADAPVELHTPQLPRPAIRTNKLPVAPSGIEHDRVFTEAPRGRRSNASAGLMNFPG